MERQDINKQIEQIVSMSEKGIIKNRINRITLKQFRGFEKESEINFKFPLSVVVGKNGSGKTTVLRMIQLLGKGNIPQNEFFEIDFDSGNLRGAEIEYYIDGQYEKLCYLGKNRWRADNEIEQINVKTIRPKAIVGAIDKSFLYDNIGRKVNKSNQVKYLIKQSRKIQQSPENTAKKQRKFLSSKEVSEINYILQSDYEQINLIRHRFFGGTWATTVLFKKKSDGQVFCEYNAGSGEFLVVNIVDQLLNVQDGSVVLIDEPEVSLHPGAQRRLLKFILTSIIRKKIQVVISTHSREMVAYLPSEAIICIEKQYNGISRVANNILPEQAFLEIEIEPNAKQIIVEDDMACSILQEILKAEKMDDLLKVVYIPGGASNLKKYIIPAFSKTNVNDQFIWFDGDQYKQEIPDFAAVPKKDKDEQYFKDIFKKCVGIDTKNIDWCPDGNVKAGRINKDQEKQMIEQYLDYYKKNVFFLPKMIPEDIVYDENRIKILLMTDAIPDSVMQAQNSKAKIKMWSDERGMPLSDIEKYLIYTFVQMKNDIYKEIVSTLRRNIGE